MNVHWPVACRSCGGSPSGSGSGSGGAGTADASGHCTDRTWLSPRSGSGSGVGIAQAPVVAGSVVAAGVNGTIIGGT
ncbi:hypothetical protein [Streptomyces sp. ERV7]|uniref:hypothetical protein n=1 Tax=Streptomyces sp. ERV7 TaxID=1322334 RepID=UPI0009A021EC|nr:hypothetical protein [Streptomyces sp. ERV7]